MSHNKKQKSPILDFRNRSTKSQKTSNVTAMEHRAQRSLAEKHKSIINVIAYCIENDEQGMKALLKRNGVNTDLLKTKRGLTKTFLNALSKSDRLALEFNNYIEEKKNQPEMFGIVGFDFTPKKMDYSLNYTFQNTGLGGTNQSFGSTSSAPTLASTTFNESATGTGFFSGLNLKDLINSGVNIMEIKKDLQLSNNNKEAIAQAVQIKRDEINLRPSKKSSVGTYIAVGIIGLIVIGGIIWFTTKKK